MNFKVFAVVFVGLLAVNASVQSPKLKDIGIKKIIIDVLDVATGLSTSILEKVNEVVATFEKNQNEIKDKIVAYSVNVGKEINGFILKGIDELKDGATDNGKAILNCIDAEQPKTEAAFTQVFKDIGACAAGENHKLIAEVKAILGQFSEFNIDVKKQIDTLNSCKDSELTCLLSFVSNINTTVKKVPMELLSDLLEILQLVKTIIDDVSGCAGDVVKEVRSDVQDIFNEAVVCIKK